MKINLLDAGLRDRGGHHFDFDRSVARYLTGKGHDVHIYGYAGMEDDIQGELEAFAPVSKPFRPYHYTLPHQVDDFAGELIMFGRHSEILMQDLRSVREADLWFWPSLRAEHLMACARSNTKASVVGCIHEDPGIEIKSIGSQIWRYTFFEATRRKLRYTVGSVEPEIRHRYMQIVPNGRFLVFPHPFDGEPIEQPKKELKRIGFFGHQRLEKGTKLLSRLIQRLAKNYDILLQDSFGLPKQISHPRVKVLDYVDDLNAPLRSCDLLVLPYDIEGYRMKGSGILAHCMILGIPVVGPWGTIPGRLIEQYNIGALFGQTSASAIQTAIQLAENNYKLFADNAFKLSRQFSKRNGSAHFAEIGLTFG